MNSQDGLSVIPSTIKGFAQDHQLITSSNPNPNPITNTNPNKKKRNLPGTPDPDAEIIAMSPKSLMATNRFICEICNKGFQRDQNLQLHRRGHNLPWKLKQRNKNEIVRKKVYICPEKSCVHNDPCRALGDLTGIKKHYSRKHGEKKWKCEKCSKKYAVQSDWKAHSKICGTREYKCDCGTLFSRKDSFITHRAFCDALAEENARFGTVSATNPNLIDGNHNFTNNNINLESSSRSIFQQNQFSGSSDQSVLLGNNHQRPNTRLPIWLLDPAASNNSHLNSNPFVSANNSTTFPSHPGFLQTTTPPPLNMFGSLSSPSNLSQTHQWLNNKLPEGINIIPWSNNLSISSFQRGGLKEEQQHQQEEEEEEEEEEEGKGNLLYLNNNQNNQEHSSPLAHMSATALLQKATQMGSSSSNPLSIFNGRSTSNFGLTNSAFNDFVTSLSSNLTPTNTLGDGSLMFSTSFLGNNLEMQPSANLKQDKVVPVLQANTSTSTTFKENETRDFLGVGGDQKITSGSFFQQELANFVSMGDLTHYSTGQH